MTAQTIWVIGWDYGSEGKTAPAMAFTEKDKAEDVIAIIKENPSAMACYLAEVPIWGTGDE